MSPAFRQRRGLALRVGDGSARSFGALSTTQVREGRSVHLGHLPFETLAVRLPGISNTAKIRNYSVVE